MKFKVGDYVFISMVNADIKIIGISHKPSQYEVLIFEDDHTTPSTSLSFFYVDTHGVKVNKINKEINNIWNELNET